MEITKAIHAAIPESAVAHARIELRFGSVVHSYQLPVPFSISSLISCIIVMRLRWVMVIYCDRDTVPKHVVVNAWNGNDILSLLDAAPEDHVRVSHWHTLKTTGNRLALYTINKQTLKERPRNHYLRDILPTKGHAIIAGHTNDYDLGNITKRELHEYLMWLAKHPDAE